MKFSINVAFLAALNFGAVRSDDLTEDIFWRMYTQDMGSMSMSMSMSMDSTAPTESPTLGEVSFVPVPTATPTAAPVPITDPPTTDPPTVIEEAPVSSCSPIETILCNVPEFSTFCDLIGASGLSTSFSEDTYTVFAPTNNAFDNIPMGIADELAENNDMMRDTLLYHAAPEMVLPASNLTCGGQIMMANQEMSTTVCTVDGVFQAGPLNPPDALPQIIARDGAACNGIIHAVDEVLLPASTETPIVDPVVEDEDEETGCDGSLADVICSLPEFGILCSLVGTAGLTDVLSGDDTYTVFAPVNSAFETLPVALADVMINDSSLLPFVLLSHVVGGEVFSFDLSCGGEVTMASSAVTNTTCVDDDLYQVGTANAADDLPKIISTDGVACNGVIHAIDQVIVPEEIMV